MFEGHRAARHYPVTISVDGLPVEEIDSASLGSIHENHDENAFLQAKDGAKAAASLLRRKYAQHVANQTVGASSVSSSSTSSSASSAVPPHGACTFERINQKKVFLTKDMDGSSLTQNRSIYGMTVTRQTLTEMQGGFGTDTDLKLCTTKDLRRQGSDTKDPKDHPGRNRCRRECRLNPECKSIVYGAAGAMLKSANAVKSNLLSVAGALSLSTIEEKYRSSIRTAR